MNVISRRDFHQQISGSLLTWSLLDTLFSRNAFADDVRLLASKWLANVNTISLDLKGGKLDQATWQKQVDQLLGKVDLPDLLKFLDFDKLTRDLEMPERGELSLRPTLPKVEGLPTNLVFGNQVFALNKDRSVIPHGHDNMATAFIVLKGNFRGKHFDRLEDDKSHMIIVPTIDDNFGPGTCSTVTDLKDNVHWFKATEDQSFIFNIHVMNVKPGATGRVYIDPNGEKLSNNRIKARKINYGEANKLYG